MKARNSAANLGLSTSRRHTHYLRLSVQFSINNLLIRLKSAMDEIRVPFDGSLHKELRSDNFVFVPGRS